jgi:hypothetical protein
LFTNRLTIMRTVINNVDVPSQNIEIVNNEFTTSNTGVGVQTESTLMIRTGSKNITVDGNAFHHTTYGILGPPQDPVSDNIIIKNNHLYRLAGDGIQFGSWNNVQILNNTIDDINDASADGIHNDGIQILGNVHNLDIKHNTISYSNDQLILVQTSYGAVDGMNVINNYIYNCGGYAIQSQGATKAVYAGNVIWATGFGGLLLRGATGGGTPVSDTIVANNIIDQLKYFDGATAAYEDYNLYQVISNPPPTQGLGPHDLLGVDPKFVDPANYNFHLQPLSPALSNQTSLYPSLTTL